MAGGLLITLEGVDGAGKSTLSRRLAERLRGAGHDVVETREPGGAPGAEEIRRLLVEGAPGRWSPETEILLFTAARRDHAERTIEPSLAAGKIVLCDRYVDSTRAYQVVDDPARRRLVDRLHEMLIGREADVTLVLDLDPQAALGRAAARAEGAAETRFEDRGFPFQERLRLAFRALAAEAPDRCCLLDASEPGERVAERAWAAIAPRLPH